MFLLDTVIVSELRRKTPDGGVVRWVSKQQGEQLHLSTALTHGLTVVTRNTSHFEPTAASLINPFATPKR